MHLAKLREAFDALLINEVKRYNGIPLQSDDEVRLRDAVAEVLQDMPVYSMKELMQMGMDMDKKQWVRV
jgi:hypothetical protein